MADLNLRPIGIDQLCEMYHNSKLIQEDADFLQYFIAHVTDLQDNLSPCPCVGEICCINDAYSMLNYHIGNNYPYLHLPLQSLNLL